MRIQPMLTKLFKKSETKIHGAQVNFLSLAVDAILNGAYLTCASLGRSLTTKTTEKHTIKRVNNMLGNEKLFQNKEKIYHSSIQLFLNHLERPLIAVDWSSTNPTKKFHILRATLMIRNKGRGIILYEQIHPQKKLANPKVHCEFLLELKRMLPKHCKPIFITDAGFHSHWFKHVIRLGWDYVGRIRGCVMYKTREQTKWLRLQVLFEHATKNAKDIGELLLSKKTEWLCRGVIVKKIQKNRKRKTVTGKVEKASAGRKNAKRVKEPWFLVTSLTKKHCSANRIVKIYERRMQIEENFRDSKNHRYGMGLKENRSISAERIAILVLIGFLAHLIAYAIGLVAKSKNIHKHFQANTVSKYQVLSFIFLGKQVYKSRLFKLTQTEVSAMLDTMAIHGNNAFE